MTKLRAPLSEHHAVKTIVDRIGMPAAVRAARRHAATITSWTDPARRGDMPHAAAGRLDAAFLDAGGGYPPIACAYMAQLRMRCSTTFYGAMARAELAARAALEAGQASAACLEAYAGTGGASALLCAERETEEAIIAYAASLHDIRRQLGAHGIERACGEPRPAERSPFGCNLHIFLREPCSRPAPAAAHSGSSPSDPYCSRSGSGKLSGATSIAR